MKLETIKVECGDDFMVINADDFDPKKHVRYGERKAEPKPAKVAGKKKSKAD